MPPIKRRPTRMHNASTSRAGVLGNKSPARGIKFAVPRQRSLARRAFDSGFQAMGSAAKKGAVKAGEWVGREAIASGKRLIGAESRGGARIRIENKLEYLCRDEKIIKYVKSELNEAIDRLDKIKGKIDADALFEELEALKFFIGDIGYLEGLPLYLKDPELRLFLKTLKEYLSNSDPEIHLKAHNLLVKLLTDAKAEKNRRMRQKYQG